MRWIVSFVGIVVLTTQGVSAATAPVFSVSAAWEGEAPRPGTQAVALLRVTVAPGWHVNSNVPIDEYLIPTSARIEPLPGWVVEPPKFPPHSLVTLAFSEGPVAVFAGTFEIRVPVRAGAGPLGTSELRGAVEAQACNDKACLAPAEVSFVLPLFPTGAYTPVAPTQAGAALSVPATPLAPATPTPTGLSQGFASSGLMLQILLVFLAGLALNLTPCVYPLIPITIGFFSAQKETSRGHIPLLAASYVLGMAVTYSALGVGAALSGRLFGAALQSPWVIGLIVIVLLALAASMFGLWELRGPAWATRYAGGRAGFGGALLMGLMVGLVAAPCIGPFVLGLLTYVGQRQDPVLGFVLFFSLSLGLGVPYLLLALFTGALEKLPNSGAWMLGVRQLFGVLLVALSGYFAKPLLPSQVGDWLFAGLLIAGGLYLLLIARPGNEQPWIDRVMRAASAAVLVFGVLLAPRPQAEGSAKLAWQEYDEAAVSAALAGQRPVVLDFHATWCLPCKELDEKTFSDASVRARLADFARFKVDLTASDPRAEAIRQRFGIAGVPTIAFFVAGKEVGPARLTGFEPPRQFLARLDVVTQAR